MENISLKNIDYTDKTNDDTDKTNDELKKEITKLNQEINKRDNIIKILSDILEIVNNDTDLKTEHMTILINIIKNQDFCFFDDKNPIDWINDNQEGTKQNQIYKYLKNTKDFNKIENPSENPKIINTLKNKLNNNFNSITNKKDDLIEIDRIIHVDPKTFQKMSGHKSHTNFLKTNKGSNRISLDEYYIIPKISDITENNSITPNKKNEIKNIEENNKFTQENLCDKKINENIIVLNLNKPGHEIIIIDILKYLNTKDLVKLSFINKNFNILSKNNKFWNPIYFKEFDIIANFDEKDVCNTIENAKEKYSEIFFENNHLILNKTNLQKKSKSELLSDKISVLDKNTENPNKQKNINNKILEEEKVLTKKNFSEEINFKEKYFELKRITENWRSGRPVEITITTPDCTTTGLNLNNKNELISTFSDGSACLYKFYSLRKIYENHDDELYMQHHKQTNICDKSINFHGHSGPIWGIDRDEDTLFTGSYDKTIKLWDVKNGTCLHTIRAHHSWVSSLHYEKTQNILLSSSYDTTIKLWQVADYTINNIHTIQGEPRNHILCVRSNLTNGELICGTDFKTVDIWDVNRMIKKVSLIGHMERIYNVKIYPEKNFIISGSNDHDAMLWDTRTNDCVMKFSGHQRGISQVEYNHINNKVITSSFDKTIKIWDIRCDKEIKTLEGHSGRINTIACDFTKIISGSEDKSIKVWNFLN